MRTTGRAEEGVSSCLTHGPGRLSGVFFRPDPGDFIAPGYVCARCWEEAGEPARIIPEHFIALTWKVREWVKPGRPMSSRLPSGWFVGPENHVALEGGFAEVVISRHRSGITFDVRGVLDQAEIERTVLEAIKRLAFPDPAVEPGRPRK